MYLPVTRPDVVPWCASLVSDVSVQPRQYQSSPSNGSSKSGLAINSWPLQRYAMFNSKPNIVQIRACIFEHQASIKQCTTSMSITWTVYLTMYYTYCHVDKVAVSGNLTSAQARQKAITYFFYRNCGVWRCELHVCAHPHAQWQVFLRICLYLLFAMSHGMLPCTYFTLVGYRAMLDC